MSVVMSRPGRDDENIFGVQCRHYALQLCCSTVKETGMAIKSGNGGSLQWYVFLVAS